LNNFIHEAQARVEAAKFGAVEALIFLLRDSSDPDVVGSAAFTLSQLCLENGPSP